MRAPAAGWQTDHHPMRPQGRTLPYLCIAIVAFAAALAAAHAMGTTTWEAERADPIYVPRMEILRPALLGFTGLAADLTWLRTIQYVGGRVERQESFPQLYLLIDTVTSLDPYFLDAYQYGGLFLVIAKQYPQAIAIYQKGIAALPNAWELPHDLGRLYFLTLRDYSQALVWWQITDRLPGRPHYLPRFIARLNARTGHLATALELWRGILQTSRDPWSEQLAQREIAKLEQQMRDASGRRSP